VRTVGLSAMISIPDLKNIRLWHLLVRNYRLLPFWRSCIILNLKLNSVVLVRERTIPTERPLLVEKSVTTFADRGCRVVSATDPRGSDYISSTYLFSIEKYKGTVRPVKITYKAAVVAGSFKLFWIPGHMKHMDIPIDTYPIAGTR
jgi:hypothetical protein